jgi:hypothetical protein
LLAVADPFARSGPGILESGTRGEEQTSISALLDGALRSELGRLVKGYSHGEPWSRHRGGLPGGRPERPLPDEWRERLRAEREGCEE